MKNKLGSQRGFTLVELGLVMAIAAILFSFSIINLVNVQKITSVNSAMDELTTNISSQQTKAMSGVTDINTNSAHGIYFLPDRYILFKGADYTSTDSSNFTIKLGANIEFADSFFQNNLIVFLPRSGEVKDYLETGNKISVQNTGGLNKQTVSVNKYGVITGIE